MDHLQRHWDHVYSTKQPHEVSWTQVRPHQSLQFIQEAAIPKDAAIIDIGGGDSLLVDYLLDLGYEDITVLDISAAAIARAKARLGDRAAMVHWIVSDIQTFVPARSYALWHDRATFHFLTTPAEIADYISKAAVAVTGFLTIGTFSEQGPERCSGLPVRQYSEEELTVTLTQAFHKISCIHEDHVTPFQTVQNFVFCNFAKAVA